MTKGEGVDHIKRVSVEDRVLNKSSFSRWDVAWRGGMKISHSFPLTPREKELS